MCVLSIAQVLRCVFTFWILVNKTVSSRQHFTSIIILTEHMLLVLFLEL